MGAGLRTLLVGIDAACWRVLEPLFDDDVLPTLERVFEAGANGRLRSQVPPWTASAWPSLYTGMNPGKHGVFDFLTFDDYDWSVVDASCVRVPPLWHLLDYHDHSSVVVNVPVTYPPAAFAGALVPGYTAPEDPTCHPPGVLAEIRDATGPYRVYPEHTGESNPDRDRVVSEHETLVAMRGRAFRYLVDRFDPDFGFLQFQGTDSVVHELEGDVDAIRAVYRAVDRSLGRVLDACDPDTVLVASDHGIGPYGGHEVRVNEVLRQAGFVETVRGGRGMPTWASARDRELARGHEAGSPDPSMGAWLTRTLARTGITSQRVERVLQPLGLVDVVTRAIPTDAIRAGTEQVDFARSTAYVRSRVECGVRLNVADRESEGVIPPEEYETVREEVIGLLSSLETPAGDAVFETVAPREEIYDGPAISAAPDVVTVPAKFDHLISAQLRDDVFDDPREPWNHKRDGVVAVHGAALENDATLSEAHLFDVAPTVLASLDLPVADHMDGESLGVVPATDRASYPVDKRTKDRTDETDIAATRLRDLGYIQ